MSDHSAGLRTFKYRLYPSPAQEKRLFATLNAARNWYNMCVADRKWAHELENRNVTRNEQLLQVKFYKRTFAPNVHSHVLQVATVDCHRAFEGFFRRVKAGTAPGYPRFKSRNRFTTFGYKQLGNGFKLDGRRLSLSGIGRIAVRWDRHLEGQVKTLRIQHKAGRWYAFFITNVVVQDPLPPTGRHIGIDVGVSAIITTSDGDKVAHPAFYRQGQGKLRKLQRKLARAKFGSKNRRKVLRAVQRQHEHVANQRADYLHKLSHTLVQEYDGIALENLRVRNMARNPYLSKSIMDSGWSIFKRMITYKAESAGREIVFVDPRNTSRCCSICGKVFDDIDLSIRWVTCDCGLSLDRDHNAARNILRRAGWEASVSGNVNQGVMRSTKAAP
jgi:putative transposase